MRGITPRPAVLICAEISDFVAQIALLADFSRLARGENNSQQKRERVRAL